MKSNQKININLVSSPMITVTSVLAVLKLCGVINCSWTIVFLPIWGPLAVVFVILLIIFLILAVKALL